MTNDKIPKWEKELWKEDKDDNTISLLRKESAKIILTNNKAFKEWVEQTSLFNAIKEGTHHARPLETDYYIRSQEIEMKIDGGVLINTAYDLPLEVLQQFWENYPNNPAYYKETHLFGIGDDYKQPSELSTKRIIDAVKDAFPDKKIGYMAIPGVERELPGIDRKKFIVKFNENWGNNHETR